MVKNFAALAAALLALAIPAGALAHVEVTASAPAEGAMVKAPRELAITFSQPANQATAAASIVMTAMPGVANHGEMMIRNFTTGWSDDGRTMTLNLRKALGTGTYELRWQAAADDGHMMRGVINFVVD